MSLWGKSESLAAGSGTVVINLSTKAVTGTNSTFLDTMVGKVITVGAAGTCGEAVIASRSSATAISVASTQFLVPDGSGNITGVAYTVTEIYGVDVTEAQTINSGSSKTAEQKKYSPAHAGWVGIQTYNDMHGNFRVKHEVLVAGSSITADSGDDTILPDS